jgi:hypothetical protein
VKQLISFEQPGPDFENCPKNMFLKPGTLEKGRDFMINHGLFVKGKLDRGQHCTDDAKTRSLSSTKHISQN